MKYMLFLVLTITVFLNKSYSQKVLKEYYDIFNTQIKEELQVNAYGLGDGFYKSYYQRGGFKETGFYSNGKKTGLWSYYSEGATKPYQQWKFDNQGRKVMYKNWYSGYLTGKLEEWTEWSQDETDENGYPLITKHILYTDNEVDENYSIIKYGVGYYMLYDLDIRTSLPLEKRYFKEYYFTGKIRHQWIFTKDKKIMETWYDENGTLTKKIIREENDKIVATNGIMLNEESDTYGVNKETYLFRDLGKDKIAILKKETIVTAKRNDQENPLYPGVGLTEFVKVSYNGKIGYVYEKDLTIVSNNESKRTFSSNISDKENNSISKEIIEWPEEIKIKMYDSYFKSVRKQGSDDNFSKNFAHCLVEKITTRMSYEEFIKMDEKFPADFQSKMLDSCNTEFYYGKKATPEYKQANDYGSLGWESYLKGDIDTCIMYSKKALAIDHTLIYCKLNLGLCYMIKKEETLARDYYAEAIRDTKSLKGKFVIRYTLQSAIDDIDNALKKYQFLKGSKEIVSLFENELLNYQ